MKKLTPLKAIRFVMRGRGGRCGSVRDCPLWPFRMGRNHSNSRDTGRSDFAQKTPKKWGVFAKSEVPEERGEALNLA